MTNTEKVKHIRGITFSPINRINAALLKANGNVEDAITILINDKQADANDMANRCTNTTIVYSYVHNNRIGAMITLACQTDFVAKNEAFLNLAKNICMHIVSNPIQPTFINVDSIPDGVREATYNAFKSSVVGNKPPTIIEKIAEGKMQKFYSEKCLLNQPFIRDESVTVGQLIKNVSATFGEKIELKYFIKVTAQ